jgi:hypothetical protein
MRSSATWRITAGGSSGSSPWTLTTMTSSAQPARAATSAIRSVPLAWPGSVISTAAPKQRHAAATASWSVATVTVCAPLSTARSQTQRIIGWPAMLARGLPGSRMDS